MSIFEASVILPRPRTEVFEYLRRPANLLKLFPSKSTKDLGLKIPEIMNVGEQIEFDVKAMGKQFHFVLDITEVSPDQRIILQQVQGPFKEWTHEQHFAEATEAETALKTVIRFEPPGGLLGFVVTRKVMHSFLEEWVGVGHEFFKKDLAAPLP